MSQARRPRGIGIGLAVLAVATASAARAVLFHAVGGGVPFITFYPAVLVSALLGGIVPGVVALAMSAVVSITWLRPPGGGRLPDTAGAITLALFVVVNGFVIWLCHRVRRGGEADADAVEVRTRLAAIVESSEDAIVSKDADGAILSWNASAERLYGYSAVEAVGQSIRMLVPPDLLGEQANILAGIHRGERFEPFETTRLRKDGEPVPVSIAISPLHGPAGRIVGAVEIVRGIGQRLRADAELRAAKAEADRSVAQLRAVISSMTEGVVVADSVGNLLEWNRAALQAHGYETVEQVRQHLHTFTQTFEIADDSGPLAVDDWPMARVLRGETFHKVELNVRRLDVPLELVIDFSGKPVYDAAGRLTLAVLTLHDVTEERRAQQALRENAQRLSLAMDAAGQGDWAWDVATDVMTLSATAAELYGLDTGTVIRRATARDAIHEADRDRARRASERAVATRTDYDIEYRVKRPGNDVIWVAAKGRGQFDAAGRMTRMMGVVQDVTARKLTEQGLRESREWLELAVSIAQMGTFQLDLRRADLTLNSAGRAIYGFDESEPLTFDGVRARFHPGDRDDVSGRVRASLRAEGSRRFETEHRIVRVDGETRWIRVRGRTLFEDTAAGPKPVRCVGTFIDVTEQKEAEQHREHLLAAEQAARAQAEHASRMKDEFLATLSHELRTPLNAILGWSQLLVPSAAADGELREGLAIIERNARAQAQIIEDLLDMSRIISGKVRLELRPLDVGSVVRTAIDTVRPTADAKGVRLLATLEGGVIAGDAGRMQQVMWNLLTNAIKFTPAGGEVRVDLRCTESAVELTVADTGEGIRPEFLPHVFDRFRQADASSTRRHGGLGLGLAIVKQLAELHGGTVDARSAGVGQGTTFVVRCPRVATRPAADDGQDPPPAVRNGPSRSPVRGDAALVGVHVLVVDDEADARSLVRRLLEDQEAGVTPAASVAEAMARLDAGPWPDVIVSDIGMPGEDGYALVARVRAMPGGGDVPIVALTAYARSEDQAKAAAAGFQAHLAKPVDAGALLAAIARLANPVPSPGNPGEG